LGQPGRDRNAPAFCDACFTGDYPISLTDHVGPREAQLSLLAELT
jgi:amidophosphoribosyltransferase